MKKKCLQNQRNLTQSPHETIAVIRQANMLLKSDWEIISVMFRTEGKKKNIKETMRRKN